jgi:hypothetical protein
MRVGTKACAPAGLRKKLNVEAIRKHVASVFEEYTVIPAKGAFRGEQEESAIVELFLVTDQATLGHSVYDWCSKVHLLIQTLLRELAQRSIITFVTISSSGREIRWSKATGFDGALQNPPFPSIAFVVRHVVGSGKVGLEALYGHTYLHFKKLGIKGMGGVCFNDLPAVGFRAPLGKPLVFKRGDKRVNAWERWDQGIAVVNRGPAENQAEGWGRYAESGSFLSLFQRVEPKPAYYVRNLARIRSQTAFNPLEIGTCPYNVGIGCCEGYYLEIIEAWLRARQVPSRLREILSEERTLDGLDSLPFPLLGLSVVTITRGEVLVRRRGSTVGAYPGARHVVPSAVVEPCHGLARPSIALTFLRELDEEMFQAAERDESFQALLLKEHIQALEGSLEFLGYALDLMHGDINILLAFRPGATWWNVHKERIRLNWEYVDAKPEYESLDSLISDAERRPSDFVPAAAVALNFLRTRRKPG